MMEETKNTSYRSRAKARNERQWAKTEEVLDRILGDKSALQLPKKAKDLLFISLPVLGLIATGWYVWLTARTGQSFFKLYQDLGIDPTNLSARPYSGFLPSSSSFFFSPLFMWTIIALAAIAIVIFVIITFGLFARKRKAWRGALFIALFIIINSVLYNTLIGVSAGLFLLYCLAQIRSYYTK